MTATSSITVEVNAQRAIVTLEQIKRNTDNATSAFERLRAVASGGFGRLEQALGRLENPLQRILKEMQAMRAGMSGGTEAALKQAQAMDRLAASVKSAESAKQRAISAQRQEIANQRQWEAAFTRETGLRERLRRQLAGDQHASARDELGNQLTTAMATYESALKKFGSGSLEGVKARGTLSREFALVSSRIAEINGLLPTLDRGFEKTVKGWASMSKMDKIQLQSNAINFTQQTIASGGPAQALMVQGPELLAIMARYPAVLGPVAAGFVAVGGAIGVVVAAMGRLSEQQSNLRDLGVIIRATGQQGTLAAKDLAALADHINLLPSVSREAAERTVQNLARIRGLGAAGVQGAAMLGPDFARAIGEQDISKATAKLGEALANPAKGARELNDALGFLSAGQLISIERMAAQGKKAEALQATMNALKPHLEGLAAQGMSPLASATDRLGNSFDHLMDVIANSSMIVGLMERMANAAQNVANAMDGPGWKWVLGSAAMANPATMPLMLRSLTQAPDPKLSLPMPPPLAQTAQAAGGGAGGVLAKAAGTSDAEKELSDVLALSDGYRSWRGQAEQLRDTLERVRRAQALTTDKDVLARLRQSEQGIRDQLRQAVDPRSKAIMDAQRSAAGAWEVARAPYDQREQVTTRLQAEAQAREAGMGVLQREALVRERLSELAAKGVQSVGDSVRAKLEEADATLRMFDVENQGIAVQQRAADELEKQRFAREALAKASDQTRSAVLAEIDVYGRLVDRMGELKTASAFRQQAISASPSLQYGQWLKDSEGVTAKMRELGATSDEVNRYMADGELQRLDASTRWQDGIERGMIRYKRSVMDAASASERAFTNAADSMTDAITRFSTGGKLAFGDFARSVISDMLRMQVQQNISMPFMSWVGSGFTSIFSAATGASNPVGTSATTTWTSPTPVTVEPLAPLARAAGGPITGPGTGTSDSILARVSNGEFVINADATSRYRPLLEAINDNRLPAFADGGYVGGMAPLARGPEAAPMVTAVGGNSAGAVVVNAPVTVNVEGGATGNPETDAKFAQQIARAASDQIKAVVDSRIMYQMRPGGLMNRV